LNLASEFEKIVDNEINQIAVKLQGFIKDTIRSKPRPVKWEVRRTRALENSIVVERRSFTETAVGVSHEAMRMGGGHDYSYQVFHGRSGGQNITPKTANHMHFRDQRGNNHFRKQVTQGRMEPFDFLQPALDKI